VCVTLAARIAAAEEAEIAIWKSLGTGVGRRRLFLITSPVR
jgi:hypothetical protein